MLTFPPNVDTHIHTQYNVIYIYMILTIFGYDMLHTLCYAIYIYMCAVCILHEIRLYKMIHTSIHNFVIDRNHLYIYTLTHIHYKISVYIYNT